MPDYRAPNTLENKIGRDPVSTSRNITFLHFCCSGDFDAGKPSIVERENGAREEDFLTFDCEGGRVVFPFINFASHDMSKKRNARKEVKNAGNAWLLKA